MPLFTKPVTSVTDKGVFRVTDYGAVGDGVTDDAAAFAAALAAIYTAKGGILVVPYSSAGYKLGTAVSIDVGQYSGGQGITVKLHGNKLLPSHAGWCIDVATTSFGVNNTGFVKRVNIVGDGAWIATSNAAATGGIRLTDCILCSVDGLAISGYSAGTAIQLYCSTSNITTWCELNRVSNLTSYGCLNGLYTKTLLPSSPGSFLGCSFVNITCNGTVANSALFRLEGNMPNAIFTNCGGYYNQNSTTGGTGFYLNGWFQGATFTSAWMDTAGTQNVATDITFGAAYTTNAAQFATFVTTQWISLPVAWRTKLSVTGAIMSAGPSGVGSVVSGNLREVLTAGRTYYVATTGNDTNSGLASTSPFLTLGKALAVVRDNIDLNGQGITIQLADGTYTGPFVVPSLLGSTTPFNLIINGNSTTPANVVLTSTNTGDGTLQCPRGARASIQNLKVENTNAGTAMSARGGHLVIGNLNVGVAGTQILANGGGFIEGNGNVTVSGNASRFMLASFGGYISFFNAVAFGTRTYTNQIFYASTGSIEIAGTFTGTVTGTRYAADMNGAIQTYTGNATFLPGSVAGYTATGGQYA